LVRGARKVIKIDKIYANPIQDQRTAIQNAGTAIPKDEDPIQNPCPALQRQTPSASIGSRGLLATMARLVAGCGRFISNRNNLR
jgi:hypothetical protein